MKPPVVTQIWIGPEDPVRALPPALFSLGVVAAENVLRRISFEDESAKEIACCTTLAYLFDLNRNVFGQRYEGPIDIVCVLRDAQRRAGVRINGRMLEVDQVAEIPLRQWRFFRLEEYPGQVISVLRSFPGVIDVADAESWLWCVLSEVEAVSRVSPYSEDPFRAFRHKWRAKLISLVDCPETVESIAELDREIRSRPQLVTVRGWCGGTVLHTICRHNNIGQLAVFLRHLQDPSLQRRFGASPSAVLNWSNYDGCTPFYAASLFGCEAAARLLERSGADRSIKDRFGRLPSRLSKLGDS